MPLTVGGGVRSPEDARALLLAGADKVAVNSAAVARPELVADLADRFGAQCVVGAVDARSVGPGRWEVFTHGGRKPTGIDAVAHAERLAALGAGELLVTSMDRDGTRDGYDLALCRAIADAVEVPLIASGGVGGLDHLVAGVVEGHASAVLAASIFHFGQHSIAEARAALASAGLPVRGTGEGLPVRGTGDGLPVRGTGEGLPVRGSGAGPAVPGTGLPGRGAAG